MSSQVQPPGDSRRVGALQSNEEHVAEAVAVEFQLHVQVADPLLRAGQLVDTSVSRWSSSSVLVVVAVPVIVSLLLSDRWQPEDQDRSRCQRDGRRPARALMSVQRRSLDSTRRTGTDRVPRGRSDKGGRAADGKGRPDDEVRHSIRTVATNRVSASAVEPVRLTYAPCGGVRRRGPPFRHVKAVVWPDALRYHYSGDGADRSPQLIHDQPLAGWTSLRS
jgi:hypothetical protein